MPLWITPFGKGFATMAALIVAIGVQNAFVLKQGVKHQAVFMTALICFLCDVVLVSLGTTGMGALIAASPRLNRVIAFGGAAFLLVYGIRSLHAAKKAQGLDLAEADKVSHASIAATALAVSLFNPHAILDTVVIVGGTATRYEGPLRLACALGALTASGLWFYGLAYSARKLAPILAKPKIWRLIDVLIGLMMLSLAVGLAYDGYRIVPP
jgi:L-lysine exporter family protein LysE/ArgO